MKALIIAVQIALTSNAALANNEFAEDAAAGVLGAIGSTYGGPSGAVVGALGGKYGIRELNGLIGRQIDRRFDNLNQELADETGFTIRTDGKVFRPNQPPSSD